MKSEESLSLISRIKDKFRREKQPLKGEPSKESQLLPQTEYELKHYFLDNLMKFQMKWATSTITDTSYAHKKYYSDSLLKYLLQRFPDTYLVMYYPIFRIKKAPIEADIIFISPIEIEVIQFLDYADEAVITVENERIWHVEKAEEQQIILNPVISLRRTEKLLKSILSFHEIDFAIKKTVVSRKNNILFANEPYNTQIIGKVNYEEWFKEKRRFTSPLKSQQIKVAEVLLKHCQTTSVKRPEWEVDHSPQTIIDLEK